MRCTVVGLLAVMTFTSVATPLQNVQGTGDLAAEVTRALQEGDGVALADLVDFKARSIDGRARGTVLLDWAQADDMDRLLERQQTAEDWINDQRHFLEDAFLYGFEQLPDPDAGMGPVPDRVITQVILKATRRGKLRDMLMISTVDQRLMELIFGEPYYPGNNPLGPAGLQPVPLADAEEQGVRWPADMPAFERQDARELVDDLLHHSLPSERRRTIEYLHRSPVAAVAALIERLLEEQDSSLPDTASQEMIVDALVTITGRDSDFRAHPDFGMDEGTWLATNRAEVMAWQRWHGRHGGSFGATPISDPLAATYDERSPERAIGLRNPSERAGGSKAGSDSSSTAGSAGAPGAGASPAAGGPAAQSPATGDPSGLTAGGLTAGMTAGETAGDDSTGKTTSLPSRVRFRKPEAPVIGPLSTLAASLTVLKVPPPQFGEPEVVSAESLVDVLPKGIARSLNHWAGAIDELDLRVAWGGDEEFFVLGRADDEILIAALDTLGRTRDLLLDVVPDIRSPQQVDPVVAIVVDPTSRKKGFWTDLLDAMLVLEALDYSKGEALRSGPVGFYNRVGQVFVQPTWDIAGDASAGDDEFRLHNELAHKFAGCLAVERCGHLPEGLLWALGHLAEMSLFDTVYQFNKTGFVSTSDHFDWYRQARQMLERRSRKRNFVLSKQVLDSGHSSSDIGGHLLAWAYIDFLHQERPTDLTQLFRDLAELHKDERPFGGARQYEGDAEATLQVIELRIGKDPVDALVDYLRSRE